MGLIDRDKMNETGRSYSPGLIVQTDPKFVFYPVRGGTDFSLSRQIRIIWIKKNFLPVYCSIKSKICFSYATLPNPLYATDRYCSLGCRQKICFRPPENPLYATDCTLPKIHLFSVDYKLQKFANRPGYYESFDSVSNHSVLTQLEDLAFLLLYQLAAAGWSTVAALVSPQSASTPQPIQTICTINLWE